jgi:uncharacterized protein HemX
MGLNTNRLSTSAADPRRTKPAAAKLSRAGAALVCSLSLAAGLFIWFKLRVVTGMPRSAYADPEQKQVNVPPQKATEPATLAKPVEPRWAPDMDVSNIDGK